MQESQIKNGDVLLQWYMPYPIMTSLIYKITGEQCDHCAIVIKNPNSKLMVYEAQPPKVRKLTWNEYQDEMKKWASSRMRWRNRGNRDFKCEIWRNPGPGIGEHISNLLFEEAESWLGVRYSMVLNFLFSLRSIHCSEFCARVLMKRPSFEGVFNKEPSRITPSDIRNSLLNNGWKYKLWNNS